MAYLTFLACFDITLATLGNAAAVIARAPQQDVPLDLSRAKAPQVDVANLSNVSLNVVAHTVAGTTAGDICGQPSGSKIASDTRNAETWMKYNIDDWISKAIGPIQANGYKATDGTPFNDFQSAILHLSGNEGAETCDEISSPVCTGTGLDFNLCTQHPEAHFVFFAITHFANFLHKLQETITSSTLAAGLDTATVVKQFYTPRESPNQLILPVSIINGAFTLLGLLTKGPQLVTAGATIASGALTQAGLDAVDPLVQWGDVQTAIGKLYQAMSVALDQYFNATFNSWGTSNDYLSDATAMPQILKGGAFAENVPVGTINPQVFGAVISPAINSLWVQDKVFIIKISDYAMHQGPPGFACHNNRLFGNSDQVVCIDGIAYIFARWEIEEEARSRVDRLNVNTWYVWGTTDKGSGGDGSKNANHLGDYGLSLDAIVRSANDTQAKHGYLYENTKQDTLDALTQSPTNISQVNLASWTIPICDIDAILKAHGKSYLTSPGAEFGYVVTDWAVCTCLRAEGWPKDKYPSKQHIDNPECWPGWA